MRHFLDVSFSFITITSGTSVTISKIAGQTESNPITIVPKVFPNADGATFDYKVLDMRGLTAESLGGGALSISDGFDINNLPPFDHPNPISADIIGAGNITINAQPQQITSQRSIGIEVSKDGAASAFVTVTIEANNTTA